MEINIVMLVLFYKNRCAHEPEVVKKPNESLGSIVASFTISLKPRIECSWGEPASALIKALSIYLIKSAYAYRSQHQSISTLFFASTDLRISTSFFAI